MRRAFFVLFSALLVAAPALAEISVTYRSGVSPVAGWDGGIDSYITHGGSAPYDPDATYDQLPFVKIGGSPINEQGLIKFDVSSLAGGTVNAVSLTIYVTNASPDTYTLYQVKTDWLASEATWNQPKVGAMWNTPGALGDGIDYVSTALASTTPTTTGVVTIVLPVSANAVVQGWANTPSSNHGLLIKNLTTNDGFAFASSDAPTVSQRPLLTVNYTPAAMTARDATFRNGDQPTAGYVGCSDTTIANGQDAKTKNFGKADLVVGGLPSTDLSGTYYGQAGALLKFNLDGIPATARVDSAQLELNVVNAGPKNTNYSIYALSRPWTELGVTWNTTDGGDPWQVPGVLGAGDHDGVVIGLFNGPVVGANVYPFNDAGVAAVQRWLNDARTNDGVIIQNYSAPSTTITFSSRESKTGTHPGFTVTYVEGTLAFEHGVIGVSPGFVSTPFQVLRADGVGGTSGLGASTVTVRASTAGAQLSLSPDGGFGGSVDLQFAAQQTESAPFYFRDANKETVVLTADAGNAYDSAVSAAIEVKAIDGGEILPGEDGGTSSPTPKSTFGWGCTAAPGGLAMLTLLGLALWLLRR